MNTSETNWQEKLTIIILTYNEEKNLAACLKSISSLQVPVFAVDSYSTDSTIEILESKGISYTQHPFENYAKQRNWSQANNPFNTEWVFHLDAGERLTPELVKWLQYQFDPNENDYNGYMFSRRTIFFDHWIRHGGHYPNFHLRLYRATQGNCEEKVYDQHFVVKGKVQTVQKGIDIIDTVADNLRDFTISHARWAMFEAVEMLSAQKQKGEVKGSLTGTPIERQRWLKNNVFQRSPMFTRSVVYFLYRYFFKMGFLDGTMGLIFHFLQGFWFRFLVDSVVFEMKTKMKQQHITLNELIEKEYDPKLLQILE